MTHVTSRPGRWCVDSRVCIAVGLGFQVRSGLGLSVSRDLDVVLDEICTEPNPLEGDVRPAVEGPFGRGDRGDLQSLEYLLITEGRALG